MTDLTKLKYNIFFKDNMHFPNVKVEIVILEILL